MRERGIEFRISHLAAWTTVSDLDILIKKGNSRYLALAWGDQDVVYGKAPPFQAVFECVTDLEDAPRAFGLSVRYKVGETLAELSALFDVRKSACPNVKLIGLRQSVDLGERNWLHSISEVHDFRNGKTHFVKDTSGLVKIHLKDIKTAAEKTDVLCEEMYGLSRNVGSGNTESDNYRRAVRWVSRVAMDYDDNSIRHLFIDLRDELKIAQTPEEFFTASVHYNAAILIYGAAERKKSSDRLNKTLDQIKPTKADIDNLHQTFPISLEYAIASSTLVGKICGEIKAIKKLALGEWFLQKPIQEAYMYTGVVYPDREISLIASLAAYADHVKEEDIEGARSEIGLAKILSARLIQLKL
jgi:hypothetical protein